MEYYSATKENEIMPFATTWMDLDMIIPSEVSQRPHDITYMWNLKKKKTISEPYIQNKNRPTDTENKQGTKRESQGVGINQEFRININRLLYVK